MPATTPPSGWDGAAGAPVTVVISNGNPDVITVWNQANTTQLTAFGSVNLGDNGCITTAAVFTGSTVTWTDASAGFTITLGALSAGAVATVATNETAVWTPTNGAMDRAGNRSTVANVTETGTADRNL